MLIVGIGIIGQLILYINGELKENKDKEEKAHNTDAQTRLTVGKPNHVDKHYGRFKMDLLSIYYYVLTETEIRTLWDSKYNDQIWKSLK